MIAAIVVTTVVAKNPPAFPRTASQFAGGLFAFENFVNSLVKRGKIVYNV